MNKILEYQKLDLDLMKLKKSNQNNEDKDNMMKLKKFIMDAYEKSNQLDNLAKSMLNDYNKLKKQYEANCNKVQELTMKKIDSVELDEIDEMLSLINSLSSELFLLDRDINIIITKMKNSLKDFEVTKNKTKAAKQKYNESKTKYEKGIEDLKPKIQEIENKMKSLEKDLNPELFAKYKAIKNDKIFPVFVSFANGNCSGCRVEIPTSKINKLKSEGSIVCEQCHRIIYYK
jgi:predicted  nucleic acid-binding Zn-ribbon protein